MKNLLGNEIKFISVSFSIIPEIHFSTKYIYMKKEVDKHCKQFNMRGF